MDSERSAEQLHALRRKVRLAALEALQHHEGRASRADIREYVFGRGDFSDAERNAPPPAKAAERHASYLDYAFSWTLTNLKRDGLVTNPARSIWALAGAAAEAPEPLAVQVIASRLEQLRSMPYRDYLHTPEWRETRGAALVRYGHACALDATHTVRLEVHHRDSRDYRRGEERVQDVIVLCHECHLIHHQHAGRPGRPVPRDPSVAPPGFVADVTPFSEPAEVHQPRSLFSRLFG